MAENVVLASWRFGAVAVRADMPWMPSLPEPRRSRMISQSNPSAPADGAMLPAPSSWMPASWMVEPWIAVPWRLWRMCGVPRPWHDESWSRPLTGLYVDNTAGAAQQPEWARRSSGLEAACWWWKPRNDDTPGQPRRAVNQGCAGERTGPATAGRDFRPISRRACPSPADSLRTVRDGKLVITPLGDGASVSRIAWAD